MRRVLFQALCIGLLAFATFGCGDSDDDNLNAPSGQQGNAGVNQQTGSVTFRFAQAQGVITVPTGTDALFFEFFDDQNSVYTYEAEFATIITVPNVPVSADFVRVTALDANGFPTAEVEGDIVVRRGTTSEFTANNTTAEPVTLTAITPLSSGLSVNAGSTLNAPFNNAFRLDFSNGQQTTLSGAQVQGLVGNDDATLTASNGNFTIDQNGNIVGVTQGTGNATFTYGGQTASIPVTIGASSASNISVSPTSLTLVPGSTSTPLTFSQTTGNQTTSVGAGEFNLTSSNENVATVDQSGVIVVSDAATTGQSATITGTRNGQQVTTTVTVGDAGAFTDVTSDVTSYQLPAGASSQPIILRGEFSNGSTIPLDNSNITFNVTGDSDITVGNGGVINVGAGATTGDTATITGTAGGQSFSIPVTVGAVGTSSIQVSPNTLVVDQGDTTDFTVTRVNSDGTTTDITNDANLTFTNAAGATNIGFNNGVASGTTAGSGTGTLTYTNGGDDFTTNYGYTVR